MEEVKLDLVELQKLDLTFPYISKEDIQKCFGIKDTTYIKWKKQFLNKVNEKFYPMGSCLTLGKEQFNIYAFLHFATNYSYFQDKRLAEYVEPYSRKTVQIFREELGVK
jgi:hypothetical protein|nr:MAG TPA: hypothetical protein [Caudoviricetes sp.]